MAREVMSDMRRVPGLSSWLFLGTLVWIGCGEGGSSRLPPSGFKAEFGKHNLPTEMVANQTLSVEVTVRNVSPNTWPSKANPRGMNVVHLSYHWLDRKRQPVVYDGLRTQLPGDLKPGESVTLKVAIRSPDKPGEYVLQMTLVQEGVAWFSDQGGGQISLPVSVVKQ